MCGRYNLITDAQALLDFLEIREHLTLTPRYNIAPSQRVIAVSAGEQGRALRMLRWGLVPSWARDVQVGYRMINARAETVAEKPSFRNAFRARRCLIPATGFYEWRPGRGGNQPYHFRMGDGQLMAFAGLWERWQRGEAEAVESCTILVTSANPTVAPVHDRMPVILDPKHHDAWLAQDTKQSDLLSLLKPCPAQWLEGYPVSRRMGNPRVEGPECIEAIGEEIG